MAQLKLTSEEPLQIMLLVEQMFGVDMTKMKQMLEDTTVSGSFELKKKITADVFAVLSVEISQ